MEVTYQVKRKDLWRVAAYTNIHHPQVLGYLLFIMFMLLLTVCPPLMTGNFLGAFRAGLQLIVFVFLVAFVIIAFRVYRQMPSENTERFCTERVGPSGFECIVPERHHSVAWTEVLKIVETTQDIFVFAKKSRGYIVPKHAFDSPEQAQAFFETATRYWQAAKSGQGVMPPHDETVWPPAPRV